MLDLLQKKPTILNSAQFCALLYLCKNSPLILVPFSYVRVAIPCVDGKPII
ncbi:hypothetical protein LEP1GSC051_1780 [Leptospira sp. P2653]|nr:hypothetical protein LEP1GSC051_1780 [Leptospira sp. P2653]